MIRALAAIAATGFIVSAVSLAAAVGIAGPEVAKTGWSWGPDVNGRFVWGSSSDRWGSGANAGETSSGAAAQMTATAAGQSTRDVAWTGGDALEVDVPAEVRYVQGTGAPKLTITGPADAVGEVRIEDGRIFYPDDDRQDRVTITLSAPSVSRFALRGGGDLAVSNYNQDSLSLELEAGSATASGRTRAVKLNISGDGRADLGGLKVQDASIDVEGSGTASVAPRGSAEVDISGSGDVTLLSHPAKLQTNISGSGHIREQGGPTANSAGGSAA